VLLAPATLQSGSFELLRIHGIFITELVIEVKNEETLHSTSSSSLPLGFRGKQTKEIAPHSSGQFANG
jgi:hypothetical protein